MTDWRDRCEGGHWCEAHGRMGNPRNDQLNMEDMVTLLVDNFMQTSYREATPEVSEFKDMDMFIPTRGRDGKFLLSYCPI